MTALVTRSMTTPAAACRYCLAHGRKHASFSASVPPASSLIAPTFTPTWVSGRTQTTRALSARSPRQRTRKPRSNEPARAPHRVVRSGRRRRVPPPCFLLLPRILHRQDSQRAHPPRLHARGRGVFRLACGEGRHAARRDREHPRRDLHRGIVPRSVRADRKAAPGRAAPPVRL